MSNLSAMTPTSVDSDGCCKTQVDSKEQNALMDGCLMDKETTNSLLVEDHSIQKFQENVLTDKDMPAELINKVYGPIVEVGLLEDSKEMAKKSYLPRDSNLFSEQKDNGANNRPADNKTGSIQPTDDASSGTRVLTPPTFNMVRNIQPIDNAAENYHPAENVIAHNRPQNPEPSNIVPLFTQSANRTFQPQQPAENPDVFVHPGDGTLVCGYQPTSMYGCQIYGQMNSSTRPRSSTTDTPGSEAQ